MFRVTIESAQRAGNEHDSTRQTARGCLSLQGGQAVLSYTEVAEDGAHTDVTVRATDTEVSVQRGSNVSPLRMQLGRRCTCEYATPYGNFTIITHTHRIQNLLTAEGGTLTLLYDLEFGGGVTETTLRLTVQKTEEPS